jgi:hypothetical protein
MRGCVPLHVPVVHLNDAGEKNREECNEEHDEGENVLVREVTHKCQPCSTSEGTTVK